MHGASFRPPPRAECGGIEEFAESAANSLRRIQKATEDGRGVRPRHDDGDGSGGRLKRASWRRTLSARAQCLRKTAEFSLNQKSSGRIFLRPLSRHTAKGASRIPDVNGTTSDTRSERVTFSSSSSSSSALSEW
jgi:hypothetical protein